MRDEQMVLTELHRNTLLELDGGRHRFLPGYPPAAHLVRTGFARWLDDNPMTWHLELTDIGHAAISLIKCPEIDTAIRAERVDDRVYRLMQDGHIRGFAVKYPNDRWMAFDESSIPMSDDDFSSPEAIVLMMKMFEAEMTLSCRAAVAAEVGIRAPRF